MVLLILVESSLIVVVSNVPVVWKCGGGCRDETSNNFLILKCSLFMLLALRWEKKKGLRIVHRY